MTLDRQWEKFSGGPSNAITREQLRITINRRGMIYLNARSYQAFGRPKAVALFYNREADSIALEPAHARFVENFPVVAKPIGWCIHASSFCRHYRISVENTERFLRPDLTNEGQLILNLRETVTVGGFNHAKRTPRPKKIADPS